MKTIADKLREQKSLLHEMVEESGKSILKQSQEDNKLAQTKLESKM